MTQRFWSTAIPHTHTVLAQTILFNFSIHQLLLTPTTPFSSSSSQLFNPLLSRPSGRCWGYPHTHVWLRVSACMCVYAWVWLCSLSPFLSYFLFFLFFSPSRSHLTWKHFLSRRAILSRAFFTQGRNISWLFPEKLQRGAERTCRRGCLSFLLSSPPLLVLFLFNVFHTDSGLVPLSCVCTCVNVIVCLSVCCLYLNISIHVCIHTYIMWAHTRFYVHAHAHISIHTHTTSQDSAYCTSHSMHVYVYIHTYTHAHIGTNTCTKHSLSATEPPPQRRCMMHHRLTYGVLMYTYLSSATYAKQDVSKYVYSWCVRHIKIQGLIYYLLFIHLWHAVYVQREDEYSMSV